MGYLTKALLINLFGDEEGIGEAWDLYQLVYHRKKFEAIAIVIFGIFLLIIAAGIFVLYLIIKKKWSLYSSIITGIFAILITIFGLFYYFKHK